MNRFVQFAYMLANPANRAKCPFCATQEYMYASFNTRAALRTLKSELPEFAVYDSDDQKNQHSDDGNGDYAVGGHPHTSQH